ncbi:MAG: hypothetical protein GWP08_07960 [Nitrospiraceae bacterium]|nr:hypothetical protein [Nitrospiraceae bacterium]
MATVVLISLRMPEDAPLARMYRTEADLTGLARALDGYYAEHGQYPPAGPEGLRMATEHLSKIAAYFPSGPPPDAWDRPYCYVPAAQYDDPGAGALRSEDGHCAPGAYQLYSLGADGASGIDREAARHDNICNWDKTKPWRRVYRKMNKAFMRERKAQQ